MEATIKITLTLLSNYLEFLDFRILFWICIRRRIFVLWKCPKFLLRINRNRFGLYRGFAVWLITFLLFNNWVWLTKSEVIMSSGFKIFLWLTPKKTPNMCRLSWTSVLKSFMAYRSLIFAQSERTWFLEPKQVQIQKTE